jgi:hypothetical protein
VKNSITTVGTKTRPTTIDIADAGCCTIAATPIANSASSVRYSAVPATARIAKASASETIGYAGGTKPPSCSSGCAITKENTLATEPTVKATAPTTATLAPKATRRRGMAVNVARIVPVAYSEATAMAPKATIAVCPSQTPRSPFATMSSSPRAPASLAFVEPTAARKAVSPTVTPTTATADQAVLGTERSLVHSARKAQRSAPFTTEPLDRLRARQRLV